MSLKGFNFVKEKLVMFKQKNALKESFPLQKWPLGKAYLNKKKGKHGPTLILHDQRKRCQQETCLMSISI